MEQDENIGKSLGEMDGNIVAALSYFLGIISGIAVYVLEKENKFVRFHALQSAILSGLLIVATRILAFIPLFGGIISTLLSLAGLVLWILLMVKAFNKERFKIPVIGDIAENKA